MHGLCDWLPKCTFSIKKNAQTFADKLLAYSKNKCNEVERRMNVVDQNIKKKT